MTETRTAVVEREFAHPPEKLWRALTQPHLISEWLMDNDFVPEAGHHFQLRGEWGGVLECEVLALEPNRRLSYSWNFANDDPAYALESVVVFTLSPTDTGTHLRVEQSGFRPEQKQAYGGAHAGWQQFLAKLDELLPRL
ncbi:SRPBCC domain-containing protein [Devosia sp. PTR5]|uniref:SRPBCC domain-containing protein n=1 Tax=Devosia oryzisoli TaxID=2774138 RepID=A0A927FWX4_9HYPH|nr:SRPBCC domain-containing protein [Devosia oryzisoli]MBD8066629.1 SRPBCC domain-containing protein [Devosia oryzisoli]